MDISMIAANCICNVQLKIIEHQPNAFIFAEIFLKK